MANFKLKSGNKTSFKSMGSSPAKDMKTGSYSQSFEDSPAKQKDNGGSCYIDDRGKTICPPKTDEEKKKDKERIEAQIEGTYVETEEDVKRMKEREKQFPRKKSPAKQDEFASISESTSTIKPPKVEVKTKLDQYVENQKALQNTEKKDAKVDSTLNQAKKSLSKKNALVNLLTN